MESLREGKPARPDDTAFERRSIVESDVRQRAKAVSSLRFATALHDAKRATEINGDDRRLFSGVEVFHEPVR
jgi:hypothetical protein